MKFIRGDTYNFKFQRKNSSNEPIIEIADKVWFTVKRNYNTKDKLIQKTLEDKTITYTEDGFYHIEIKPEDTQNMKYGKYKCDIQVEMASKIKTIYLGTFEITQEVTF